MEISIAGVQDYCRCPLLFKFKHLDGIKKKPHIKERYIQSMKHMACSFFHLLQDGHNPTLKNIMRHWLKVWGGPQTKKDILQNINNRTQWKYDYHYWFQNGLNRIPIFYERYIKNPGMPVMVASKYRVPLGKHILTGEIDLVREVIYDNITQLELVTFVVKKQDIRTQFNLDITANSYAFRKLYCKKEDILAYHNLHTGLIEVAYRNKNDYISLLLLIEGISYAVNNNQYYPMINDTCDKCSYLDKCQSKDWTQILWNGGKKCKR